MSDDYREDTGSIQITFPAPVNISREQTMRLIDAIDEICKVWEAKHPEMVMWPSGVGGLITSMPWTKEDEDNGVPMEFDMSVLSIDCASRERYDTEHVWMSESEAKRWFPRADPPPLYCKRCGRPFGTKRDCQQVKVGPREEVTP